MPDIPPPTAADRARDAAADYVTATCELTMVKRSFSALPWIRRAIAAERSLAESVPLAEVIALVQSWGGDTYSADYILDQLRQLAARRKGT